ncbi:SPOR domain-containing protein [Ruegeria pomeroyi]|uniref:Lipoprotein, putative n=2 Tax=Ruegeria pomeroyi TaxID=89184 RepID=Q5LPW1_RUEPO|nr:SPOR domain-containing protein [Ruegeria pomeroyi]AAV95979.1 lipoprotein, putative [Ruegeria pomeroyi DSS-3]NVK97629.1 SPOR domain-containing protein [Ruegeria pomeroyi]NVL02758.1 SPOR domain-containing protein [Ruegeria pomeroyi]QWV09542.1 SPOR domain-containing protein [Ruegeria pomeroyi]
MHRKSPPARPLTRLPALGLGLLLLAGCEEGANLSLFQPKDKEAATSSETRSTKLVERDVEAPEVFQVTEAGLWDGRPSLGGVWVAHPDVKEPERVIIRNATNDKFVIGALFRREREIPGPRIQASSDAAAALGMLAGAPVELNVTALRREEVQEEPPLDETIAQADAVEPLPEVAETTLDPVAGAAAAIEAAAPSPAPAAAPAPATPPKPKAQASSLDKPYIQIGIFSVEANAKSAADQMRSAGMVPTIRQETTSGKSFWRVVVGPAQSKSERTALLKQVQGTGFSDAYAVKK